jgi:hypothetical protein
MSQDGDAREGRKAVEAIRVHRRVVSAVELDRSG